MLVQKWGLVHTSACTKNWVLKIGSKTNGCMHTCMTKHKHSKNDTHHMMYACTYSTAHCLLLHDTRDRELEARIPARMCTHTHVMMSRYAVCMHDWINIGSHAHMQYTVRIGFGVEIQLACIYTRSSQQGAYTHVKTYRHTHHNMRSPMRIHTREYI